MRRYAMFPVVSLWCFAAALAAAQVPDLTDKAIQKKQEASRVGEIIIVGSKSGSASDRGIRKALGWFVPGKALDDADLHQVEKLLVGFRATLKVIDTKDPAVKDILVTVRTEAEAKKEPIKPAATLEQLIAEALKNNPDIRVAEAKVREADAELNRTRMKVVGELSTLHAEILAAKAALDEGKERWERAHTLYFENKAVSKEVLSAAKLTLTKLTTELAALQAKLPYLLGKQPGGIDARIEVQFKWDDANAASSHELYQSVRKKAVQSLADIGSPMTDKLRKALDTPITFPRADVDLSTDLMQYVRDKGLDFNIIIRLKSTKKMTFNIQLERPIPIGAFLQYVEDELGVVFVLRDYGIVVTAADERLPPGAIRVVDFWKHGKAADPSVDPKKKAKPAGEAPMKKGELRGKIDGVNAKDHLLVQITLGADHGLKTGQFLELYRVNREPKSLGRARIMEVQATRSVVRILAAFRDADDLPHVGDEVVGQLTEK